MNKYVFSVVISIIAIFALEGQSRFTQLVYEGQKLLGESKFAEAQQRFDLLLRNRTQLPKTEYESSLIGMAKAQLGLGNFDLASEYFNFYEIQFPQGNAREEAAYRKARIYFQKEEYAGAIEQLSRFLEVYPASKYRANSYYWIAESLLQIGRIEDAETLFKRIVREFPSSYRVEAAQYRLEVIMLTKHERELRQLLQVSNEKLIQQSQKIRGLEREIAGLLTKSSQNLTSPNPILDNYNTNRRSVQENLQYRQDKIADIETKIQQLSREMSGLITELQRIKQ